MNKKKNLEKYVQLWNLYNIENIEERVLYCSSPLYGDCVLKIMDNEPETVCGINCLIKYNGQRYVKLLEYNFEDYVLLLERVLPGNQMWDITDYKERAKVFANFINNFPFIYCECGEYPSYYSWMKELCEKLVSLGEREEVLFYLDEALRIYNDLKLKYNKTALLHGDMHQENLLLNKNGNYSVIDPKGVVDDPVMETARFLMNEVPCEINKIKDIVNIISDIIMIEKEDIYKSMFVDAALGQCWRLDKPIAKQEKFSETKREVLDICDFVYGLLQ